MNELMCVIGSGPSGVACAHSLLKEGNRVLLLDVGFTLEMESQKILDKYRSDENTDEFLKSIHYIRQKHHHHSKDQPLKTLYGSEYPYKYIQDTYIDSDKENAVVRTSLAKGGFSSVWGATVSTVVPKDIIAWPISFDELIPYYLSLENIMEVVSPLNEMLEVFPVKIGSQPTFELGIQGNDLFNHLQKYRRQLLDDGIHLGRAKLGIGQKYSLDGKGCTPCGLCMHGCPNNAIFNSSFVLDSLLDNDNFTYLPNTLVELFSEGKEGVRLFIKDVNTKNRSTLKCDRLFIACGVVNTTCLVARSLSMTDHLFTILDSQKYIFPFFRWARSKGALKSRENTLAQIYLVIDNPSVSPNIVQLQYYGYNDLLLDPLRQKLGNNAVEIIPKVFTGFFERLMISFVYLHSNQSGTLSLKVHPAGKGLSPMGQINGHPNSESTIVIDSLIRLLKKHRQAHGGIPIRLGLQATLPGDSQHIGGTFPMSKKPDHYQTDLIGRPVGCKRVHLVDSSVFPSIPGTPIVYTMMANAYRIAAVASRKDRG